jgi:hypothetical protein
MGHATHRTNPHGIGGGNTRLGNHVGRGTGEARVLFSIIASPNHPTQGAPSVEIPTRCAFVNTNPPPKNLNFI